MAMALFAPLGRIVHALGHGLLGAITSADWIGIHIPLYQHGLALLNYPNFIFANSFVALWYWMGGFLLTITALVLLFAFPFPPGFISQLLARLACLYLSLTGGLLPIVETLRGDDIRFTSEILNFPVSVVSIFFALIFSGFFITALYLLIRLPCGSLNMNGFQRVVFTMVIWTLPLLLFIAGGFVWASIRGPVLLLLVLLAFFPLILAPFVSSFTTIFPRPAWSRSVILLLFCSVGLNAALWFTLKSQGPDPRGLLWGHPSQSHNIPTSLLLWRLFP